MSRLLVFCDYLPSLTSRRTALSATSYRSEQCVRPLMVAGHSMTVFTTGLFGRYERLFERRDFGAVTYYETSFSHFDQKGEIAQALKGKRFDAVVAVSQIASNYALQFAGDLPLWCDLYGSVMGEAQAKSALERSNEFVGHFMTLELPVIQRADKLSTCGQWQEHMLCGELALMGRLNLENFGYRLVHGILPGAISPSPEERNAKSPTHRGRLFPDDAHVVLWMGGYNTWMDVDTLYAGLQQAMQRHPKMYFVSIGGAIPGHDDQTYGRFQKMVARSRYRERYRLRGWVDRHEVPDYLRCADLGLNIDAWHYETVFGTRTRLVEMLGYGLPVATSLGCELSYLLKDADQALTFEIGNAEGLAGVLIEYFQRPMETRQAYARESQRWAHDELSFERTTRPLLEWAQRPVKAGDHGAVRRKKNYGLQVRIDAAHPSGLGRRGWNYLRRHGLRRTARRSYQYLRDVWRHRRGVMP